MFKVAGGSCNAVKGDSKSNGDDYTLEEMPGNRSVAQQQQRRSGVGIAGVDLTKHGPLGDPFARAARADLP